MVTLQKPAAVWVLFAFWTLCLFYCGVVGIFIAVAYFWVFSVPYLGCAIVSFFLVRGFCHRKHLAYRIAKFLNSILLVIIILVLAKHGIDGVWMPVVLIIVAFLQLLYSSKQTKDWFSNIDQGLA